MLSRGHPLMPAYRWCGCAVARVAGKTMARATPRAAGGLGFSPWIHGVPRRRQPLAKPAGQGRIRVEYSRIHADCGVCWCMEVIVAQ